MTLGKYSHFNSDVICLFTAKNPPVWQLITDVIAEQLKSGADPMKSILNPSCFVNWIPVTALDPFLQNEDVWVVILGTGVEQTWEVKGAALCLNIWCYVSAQWHPKFGHGAVAPPWQQQHRWGGNQSHRCQKAVLGNVLVLLLLPSLSCFRDWCLFQILRLCWGFYPFGR